MTTNDENSLGDAATFAGAKPRPSRDDLSLGDERTLGGGDVAGFETVIDDIEVVDLKARYTIEGTLGQGGMGAVLLATDTRLGRKVAIKRILGEAARSKTAIMRFLTEAKAIAALNHPNIVQIYDYGRAKDGPFLIMEFVDGGSLAERCKQGAIPLEEAVELACQICDGLAKAHDAGIVHRDIKPANVLLNRDGLPKLTDFGLAKAEAADHGMTMTGAVMGTPDFMPPEQRRDASLVDHRSDLWSLAASVYQMVTGRSPKIIRFNDVPAALQDVLAKALEDRKDSRYQSARELRDALKTSLRAAATAVEELVEGVCPSCGVKNDLSRRFCRGCGESLEAPCLSCTKPMPMWEEICGSCGAKQTPLVEDRRLFMAAKQAEAEGFLRDSAFDGATAIATQLRDEAHARLKHLTGWATTFLEQIEKARSEQVQEAVETIREAEKHEAACDYQSAVFALDTVPGSLRDAVLPGMRESVAGMLDRLRKTQAEVQRLESLVKERLASKQVDELLPDVERLLALRPDREDVRKIRAQLIERAERQSAARDEAVATAKTALAAHDYEAAFRALTTVAAPAVTPEVVRLREESEGLVRQVRTLSRRIKEAVTGKQLDGLLEPVEAYLRLKPADAEIAKLRQSLIDQARMIASREAIREKAVTEAKTAIAEYKYEQALFVLRELDHATWTPEVHALYDECVHLSQEADELARKISDSPLTGPEGEGRLLLLMGFQGLAEVGSLGRIVERYLTIRPNDESMQSLHKKLQKRAEDINKSILRTKSSGVVEKAQSPSQKLKTYATEKRRQKRAEGLFFVAVGLLGLVLFVGIEAVAISYGRIIASPLLAFFVIGSFAAIIRGALLADSQLPGRRGKGKNKG